MTTRKSRSAPTSPPPLTPPDCDLRDFPRLMIDVGRLFGSSFNASASRKPLAWMVGHKLWYRSWHQVPAASLPDDDDELCHLAELGHDIKSFKAVKALAMRGWVRCGDGRLYHPVVAEAALEAWLRKLAQRLSSGAGNGKRHGYRFDPRPIEAMIDAAVVLLAAIAPQSKAIPKAKRRLPPDPPGGLPAGADRERSGTPAGSQETETGTVVEKSPSQSEGGLRIVSGGATS